MSQIVLDSIAEETAKLARLVPVPTGELGYGRDLSCVTDVTERLDEVDPNSTEALGESLLRRMITPRGSLPDDKDWGIDVRGYCNRGLTQQDRLALEGEIRAELTKDDRVSSVTPSVVWVAPRLDVHVHVVPESSQGAPFNLTLAVTSGEILEAAVNR